MEISAKCKEVDQKVKYLTVRTYLYSQQPKVIRPKLINPNQKSATIQNYTEDTYVLTFPHHIPITFPHPYVYIRSKRKMGGRRSIHPST